MSPNKKAYLRKLARDRAKLKNKKAILFAKWMTIINLGMDDKRFHNEITKDELESHYRMVWNNYGMELGDKAIDEVENEYNEWKEFFYSKTKFAMIQKRKFEQVLKEA